MFSFADPMYFLLLIPVVMALRHISACRAAAVILFAPFTRLDRGRYTWRMRTARILPAFFVSALLLIVAAMARPQSGFTKELRKTQAIAIEMTVDVSGSMESLDLSTASPTGITYRTRLDVVKETFADFVAERPDDLIGLISFGGYVSTLAPLTTDHDALLHVLDDVDIPAHAPAEGYVADKEELLTALGDALATACARLENARPESKIVVLLTDGVSNTGLVEPDAAKLVARRMGVRVYTIGVGTTGQASFPADTAAGPVAFRTADFAPDEDLLRRIADVTGGRYFSVTDRDGLTSALKSINELEKTEVELTVYSRHKDLYSLFLLPALCMIVLATTVNMAIKGEPM